MTSGPSRKSGHPTWNEVAFEELVEDIGPQWRRTPKLIRALVKLADPWNHSYSASICPIAIHNLIFNPSGKPWKTQAKTSRTVVPSQSKPIPSIASFQSQARPVHRLPPTRKRNCWGIPSSADFSAVRHWNSARCETACPEPVVVADEDP